MTGENNLGVLVKQIFRCLEMVRREGARPTVTRVASAGSSFLIALWCILRLKFLRGDSSIQRHVDIVLGCKPLRPIQIRSELIRMLEVVQEKKPETVVEIGTARGGTLCLLCEAADERANILSIDLPDGEYGGGYPEWMLPLYRTFAKRTQKIGFLRADSHSGATCDELRSILGGRRIDFLFIDGDHTYQGVRRDFELYFPLVADGGMIGFHDIATSSPGSDYGVRRLWEELKQRYKHEEIFDDVNRHGYGIGLIKK